MNHERANYRRARVSGAVAAAMLAAAGIGASAQQHQQLQPAPGVPSRPLLGEMSKAEVGSAATVHTSLGSGPGMVLASSHEILASLHLVLNDRKQLDKDISVNITTPPQKPLMDVAASVIAQDPGDDLVLLRLKEAIPPAPQMPAQAVLPVAAPPPSAPATSAAARSYHSRHHMGAYGMPVPVAQSEVAVPVDSGAAPGQRSPQQASEQSFYVSQARARHRSHTGRSGGMHVPLKRPPAGTRVVEDGPAVPTNVVEDGPPAE